MKNSLLYLFVMLAVQLFASWMVYIIWLVADGWTLGDALRIVKSPSPMTHTAEMMITASVVCSVITLTIFVWRKWCLLSPAYLRTRQWGVFAWSGMAALGFILPSLWLQEQLPEMPNMMEETFRNILSNDYGYFAICLFAPLVEEIVFRGAILRALLAGFKRHWVAIAVSAVLFSLAHFNPAQIPHTLLMGLLLGWMYYRTGSILPGVMLHWVNNTVAFVMARLLPMESADTLSVLLGVDNRGVVLALIFSLMILIPALYQLHLRMKR